MSTFPSVGDFEKAGVSRAQLSSWLKQHGGGNLRAVTKTVHRDGKTFQQTFHVAEKKQEQPKVASAQPRAAVRQRKPKPQKPPAKTASAQVVAPRVEPSTKADSQAPLLRHDPKPPETKKEEAKPRAPRAKKVDVDSAIVSAGGDPRSTKRYVDKWVEHGGNESSLSLRAAWAKQSGVKLDEKRLQKLYANASRRPEGELADSVKRYIEHGSTSPDVERAARAITQVSQKVYAGQSHVEVHRGIAGDQARLIKEAIARGDKTIKISMDSASSFTDDRKIAVQFAQGKGGSYKGTDATHGVVVKFKAPVASILASHRAFPQQFDKKEKEVVIASHGVIEIPIEDIETFGK